MEHKEIMLLVKRAITRLIIYDKYLLKHSLNEPSITHKLAEHLQLFFPEYNVDCEYNGNVKNDNGRKVIEGLNEEAQDLLKEAERKKMTLMLLLLKMIFQ